MAAVPGSPAEMDRDLEPETKPRGEVLPSDIRKVIVGEEQQEWSSILEPEPPHSLKQEEPPEPPHIKEEPEELWSSQEGEQIQDITKFPFTPVPVKSEDDEEKAQSSQLHQRQTEHMEPAADGEDCGGPEPARNSHPDPHLQPDTEDHSEDSSETEDSYCYSKETREPQSGLKALKKVSETDKIHKTSEKQFKCSECGRIFSLKSHLKRHMMIHTGEKPFRCSGCGKRFIRKCQLKSHKCVLQRSLKLHPLHFSCSECGKTLSRNTDLRRHMRMHTGEKHYSCSVCEKRFTWESQLRRHKSVCLQSSQLHQNQTEENREAEPGASSSTEQINLQMKEEPEELWSSQEGEQLQDITKFPFTLVLVKSEDDEEKAQSSQLHQRQTEHMEPAADGEDCGGPEPARNSHPDPHLQPETVYQPEDSSETEDSVDYSKETREPQSGLKALKNKGSESDERPKTTDKLFSCFECGKRFRFKSSLKKHMRQMQIHKCERPNIVEKPFSCSECEKRFGSDRNLKIHMKTHTEEKRFSCSECGKRFSRNQDQKNHMRIHTGEKPFSCTVCEKRFFWKVQLKTHKCVERQDNYSGENNPTHWIILNLV